MVLEDGGESGGSQGGRRCPGGAGGRVAKSLKYVTDKTLGLKNVHKICFLKRARTRKKCIKRSKKRATRSKTLQKKCVQKKIAVVNKIKIMPGGRAQRPHVFKYLGGGGQSLCSDPPGHRGQGTSTSLSADLTSAFENCSLLAQS